MSAGRASQRVELVRGEELAVLEQVGAVGVERVAREAALQLQVGEEVEDEALEAGRRLPERGLDCDGHGGWFCAGRLIPLGARDHALAHPAYARAGARPRRGARRRRAGPRRCRGPSFGPEGRWRRSRRGRAELRGAGGDRPPRSASCAATSGSPAGTGTSTAPSSSSQHRQRVVADAAVALAGVGAERRGESRVGRPRARAAWALSSAAMPPWPRRVSEPMIPGPGPTRAASQPRPLAAASRAPATESASCSPP